MTADSVLGMTPEGSDGGLLCFDIGSYELGEPGKVHGCGVEALEL